MHIEDVVHACALSSSIEIILLLLFRWTSFTFDYYVVECECWMCLVRKLKALLFKFSSYKLLQCSNFQISRMAVLKNWLKVLLTHLSVSFRGKISRRCTKKAWIIYELSFDKGRIFLDVILIMLLHRSSWTLRHKSSKTSSKEIFSSS